MYDHGCGRDQILHSHAHVSAHGDGSYHAHVSARGYDYDYVGVLSLSDLIVRDGVPMINFPRCQETATGSKRKLASDEAGREGAPIRHDVKNHVWEYAGTLAQAYRILLTRGIKGVCVYIEDEETSEYVKQFLA